MRNEHIVRGVTVKAECLAYFPCAVNRSSIECPVVVVLTVGGVSFGLPPTGHSAGSDRARSTFTGAACGIKGCDLFSAERATENFDLIDQAVEGPRIAGAFASDAN